MFICTIWIVKLVFTHTTGSIMVHSQLGDEAVMIQGAERILHGQVPHRDFYSMQGGATYYPLVLAFRLFGDDIGVVRTVNVINALGICLAILWLCWPLLRHASMAVSLFFALVVYPTWPLLSHHWLFLLLAIVAIGLVARRYSYWTVGLAGVLTALGAGMIYNKAVALIFVLAAYLIITGRKEAHHWRWLGAYLAGIAITCAGLIHLAILSGAWSEFVRQVFVNNLTYYQNSSPQYFFQPNVNFFITLATLIIILIPLLRYSWLDTNRRRHYLALALCYAGLSITSLYYSELVHLSFVVILSIPLHILILQWLCRENRNKIFLSFRKSMISLVTIFIICVFLIFVSWRFISVGYQAGNTFQPTPSFDTPKGKFLYQPQYGAQFVSEYLLITKLITTSLHESRIMFLPYRPGYYYFTDRENPTSFDYIAINMLYDKDMEKLKQELEKVDAVVYIPGSWEISTTRGNVWAWIVDKFPLQEVYLNGQVRVFKKPSPT